MGLHRPDSGSLEILGEARKAESDFAEVRREIGLVFQDPDDQLFCPTVAEDVAFGPLNLGQTHEQAEATVTETLEHLGLKGFESRITYQLSGGEKKLVSLATVLAMKPRALLLDEPTAGLDVETTARLAEIINGSVTTCIINSHDMDFLRKTAEATLKLEGGRITEHAI